MKKVAVFGKPGSGKSQLSKQLASCTSLPLYPLDSLAYRANGERVPAEIFKAEHDAILQTERWIMDGLGPIDSFYQRLQAADTLIYIDLPYPLSYWFVTKRLLKALWQRPEGWPDGSSVVKGTLQSYKTLRLCPRFWNQALVQQLNELADGKSLHIITSIKQLNGFTLLHNS